MSIKQDALSDIEKLKNKEWEVEIKGIITPPVNKGDPEVEELKEELDVPIVYDENVTYFQVAYYEPDSNLGVPLPEKLEEMADRVDVAGGGNIAHGTLDLFVGLRSKTYELDEEKMEEAEVSFEGDMEKRYGDEGTARIETLRFQSRAEADPDDFSEDEVEQRVKDDLLGQAKEAVYSGSKAQDIKVNSPPPTDDEEELEEMEWVPERIKVGELNYEFDKILLGDEDSDPEEEVEIEEISVGEDTKRNL